MADDAHRGTWETWISLESCPIALPTVHDTRLPTRVASATCPLSRAGEGWGEGREGSGSGTRLMRRQGAPLPDRSHPSPGFLRKQTSPARERGPAPHAAMVASLSGTVRVAIVRGSKPLS